MDGTSIVAQQLYPSVEKVTAFFFRENAKIAKLNNNLYMEPFILAVIIVAITENIIHVIDK